ncbi:hypothetical protein JTE90_007637 [Oedothorax gibbosus]|uniref:Uncharacterized protein n=1 Tax=Oedothorax gibbosus TaxID=931172 RepID=A0AAV6TLE9_9ARAC|nr:hypothetical protein JTE90_007637 [Oedothorax gibbosus]
MIGRADIKDQKHVAMNAWLPRASYPCDQASFCPFALREVSVLAELALGHLRYHLTDVPPHQTTHPLNLSSERIARYKEESALGARSVILTGRFPLNRVSKETMKAVVFSLTVQAPPLILHLSCLFTTQTSVKLNRVFFPR